MKKMYFKTTLLAGAALLLLTSGGSAAAGETGVDQKIVNALKGDWGQITFDLRYRWEYVDQDGAGTANGDPIRLRLGYLTPEFAGFQAFAEFEGSTPVFTDNYNDKTNGKTEYAVIADPSEAELNQGWLSYAGVPDTVVKAGRQRINLDNQRFIGAVAWRQMEQTFDAVNLFNASLGNYSANATYIWNVRSILSEDVNMNSPLLHLQYSFKGIGDLVGYGYWLDYSDANDSGPFDYAYSTETYGARFNGKAAVNEAVNLLYTAEYASQQDFKENNSDYTADYYHFMGGVLFPNKGSVVTNITAKIAYEVLGSDNGVSFKTPLGTNHKFNGWADLFLATPADGLQDTYATIGTTVAGVNVGMTYHDFQADAGGMDYGTEFDASIGKKIGKHYNVQAFYANYNADEFKTDTEKIWLQVTMAF